MPENLPSIPTDWYCSITGEIFEDPVICEDGNSYERKAITEWLQTSRGAGRNGASIPVRSPLTNLPLPSSKLIPNRALKNSIESFFSANPDRRGKPRDPQPESSDGRKAVGTAQDSSSLKRKLEEENERLRDENKRLKLVVGGGATDRGQSENRSNTNSSSSSSSGSSSSSSSGGGVARDGYSGWTNPMTNGPYRGDRGQRENRSNTNSSSSSSSGSSSSSSSGGGVARGGYSGRTNRMTNGPYRGATGAPFGKGTESYNGNTYYHYGNGPVSYYKGYGLYTYTPPAIAGSHPYLKGGATLQPAPVGKGFGAIHNPPLGGSSGKKKKKKKKK